VAALLPRWQSVLHILCALFFGALVLLIILRLITPQPVDRLRSVTTFPSCTSKILVGLILLFVWLRFTQLLRFKQCPRCRDGTRIYDWSREIPSENETLCGPRLKPTRLYGSGNLVCACSA
jgi:hypothetical protein